MNYKQKSKWQSKSKQCGIDHKHVPEVSEQHIDWISPIFQSFQFDFFLIFLIFYWYSINRLDFVNNGKNQVVINLICCIPPSQLFTDIKPISLSSSANHDKQMHWMLPLKVMLCYDFLFRLSIFRQTSGLFSENDLFEASFSKG